MTSFISNISKKLCVTFVLMAAPGAWAATLTFDSLPDGDVASQYQSLGVEAEGAVVLDASNTPWPSQSGAKIAFAPSGLMNFYFNSSVTGNIQTVSAYVSGVENTGIYAYDASGNLLGQHLLGAFPVPNTLLSVTSSTVPITRIAIHDGGSTFAIDDLTFVAGSGCMTIAQELYEDVSGLPITSFKNWLRASKQKSELQKDITNLQSLIRLRAGQKKILAQTKLIQEKIEDFLRRGTDQTYLLNLLKSLNTRVKQGTC